MKWFNLADIGLFYFSSTLEAQGLPFWGLGAADALFYRFHFYRALLGLGYCGAAPAGPTEF